MKNFLFLCASLFAAFAFSVPLQAQDDGDDTGGETVDVITEGYYYVYTINGTNERGLYINNTSFCWEILERGNARFIFKLVPTGEENNFYMQNLYEGSWWGNIVNYYVSNFDKTEETRAVMTFAPNGDGTFKVRPNEWRKDKSEQSKHDTQDNFNCDGGGRNWNSVGDQSGPYGVWHDLSQWTGANWLVEKVSDADLHAATLNTKLIDALSVYNNANIYTQSADRLITNVDAEVDPASGEPSQFLSNCQRTNDALSSFANLIDGDLSTRFQSTWSDVPMPQWIQVDASADGNDKQIEGFQLQLGLRNDVWGSIEQPSDIAVFATNDETAAKDLDASTIEDVLDNSAWTKIGDFQMPLDKAIYYETRSNILKSQESSKWLRPVNLASELENRYVTKNIVLNGGKYRYIRFYIYNTAVNASDNHDFTLGEFQMYELTNVQPSAVAQTEVASLLDLIKAGQEKVKNRTATADDVTALEAAMLAVSNKSSVALAALQSLIDSISSAGSGLSGGTEPGYNDATKVAEYEAAYAAAVSGSHSALTDDEYTELADNVRSTLAAAQAAIVPVSDGYYNLVSKYASFYTQMAMTGLSTQKILGWKEYDENDPAQIFKVTKIGEGEYSIQNVQTGKFIGTIPGQSAEVKVTDTQETAQTFKGISGNPGQFNIANTENSMAYHTEFHQTGANSKGYICTWDGGANSGSAWSLVAVTGEKLDSLLAVAPVENLKDIAANEMDSARAAYDKTFAYRQSAYLITNCDDTDPDNCQWWSTCQEPDAGSYSSYSRLIDGDLGTCFQSTWQRTVHEKPQWMQADLQDNPVKDFSLYYGLRNGSWGAWEQWTQVTVFATNDESIAKDENIDTYEQISEVDGWKNMGVFNLPEEQAIRNYGGSNRSFVYDFNNIFDQKYRFIRFYVTGTHKPAPGITNDLGEFTIGELNIMENTYDEATAPYFYTEGLKDAADNLKAQEKTVAAAIAEGTITQEQIDQLIALRKAVTALTPVKDNLLALYNADVAYVNKFASGEEYGDVTEAEWTAIQTSLSNAKAVLDAEQPTAAEIQAQETALTEAYNVFKTAQKQFEPNKWYYIVSRCTTRNGSIQVNGEGETAGIAHENNLYATFIYGNVAYALTDNTRAAQGGWGTDNNNALRWGYYVAGDEKGGAGGSPLYTDNLDPHTMWRLIPIDGKDGQYAIQNRANGYFWGSYSGNSWQQLSTDTVAFVFENLGSGVYKFRAASASVYMQFAGDGYVYSYDAELNDPNGQCALTFEPVATDDNIVMEYPSDNSIFIKSLPYAIDEETLGMNEGYVDFYGVKGLQVIDGDSTLLLEKKTSVQAGEPFIAIAGDYEAFDPENVTAATLILPAVDDFNFEGKTVNGLTATLDYTKAHKPGLGYFADAVIKSTIKGTGIQGHTGYFDVKDMPLFTTITEADVLISLNGAGVTAIKGITAGKDGVVNVYSVDGKLLKKNVSGSKAGTGLKKGIYIVGKKKVTVK